MSDDDLVVVYRQKPHLVHMARMLLERNGILAHVHDENVHAMRGEVPFGWASLPRVVVLEKDAPEARRLVEEFEDELAAHAHDPPTDVDEPDDAQHLFSWPSCPRCGAHADVECPACGERRSEFPLADSPWPDAPTTDRDPEANAEPADHRATLRPPVVRLVCPTCDEVFVPAPGSRCPGCGELLAGVPGTGTVCDRARAESDVEHFHELRTAADDWRRAAVLVLIALVLVAVALYFLGPPTP